MSTAVQKQYNNGSGESAGRSIFNRPNFPLGYFLTSYPRGWAAVCIRRKMITMLPKLINTPVPDPCKSTG